MKNVTITQSNIVVLTGRTHNRAKASIPFYLRDIPQFDVDGSIICTIDLAGSLTSSLKFVFEPGCILKHKSGTYQIHKVLRHAFNSIPLLMATPISPYGLSQDEITTACIQLTDFEDFSCIPATIFAANKRTGNIISREFSVSFQKLPEEAHFDTMIIPHATLYDFSSKHMDLSTCSVETEHNKYRGISLGHIICHGKKHSPIILANGVKEVDTHENH